MFAKRDWLRLKPNSRRSHDPRGIREGGRGAGERERGPEVEAAEGEREDHEERQRGHDYKDDRPGKGGDFCFVPGVPIQPDEREDRCERQGQITAARIEERRASSLAAAMIAPERSAFSSRYTGRLLDPTEVRRGR